MTEKQLSQFQLERGFVYFAGAPSLFKSLKKDLVSAYWVTHGFEARMLMIFIFVLRFDWIVLDRV